MTQEEFEREFHSRTLAYQPAYHTDRRPIVIHLGPDAHTPNGHLLLAALVNQLARAHQHLAIPDADTTPLLCPHTFGLATVEQATIGLAKAINPFITATNTITNNTTLASIGIGHTEQPVDLQVGCEGWCATFGPNAHIDPEPTGRLGAMLASCITAAYAFHTLLRPTTPPAGSHSLWEYGRPGTEQGPTFDGPLDVGRVLQVGAGGVGASLDYWLALLGLAGHWTITDRDLVDVSNLNRQMAYLAADAGFPEPPAVNKAVAAAASLGGRASPDPHWYGETPTVAAAEYDVILALANDHGARSLLQARQPPVLLHATTSLNWEAQFHRHIAGRDDCINCRIPEDAPRLRCAEASIGTATKTDAALPFLSATAALLLLAGLIRLQAGQLDSNDRNFAALNLRQPAPTLQQLRRNCSGGCTRWAPHAVRMRMPGGTRYMHLDPARATPPATTTGRVRTRE